MKATVVVDVGFGDSGKGRLVDSLCQSSERPFVVRYSGGSQAGHTVMNENGKHVHSSFPAGTLAGHPGFMSRFCPIKIANLFRELDKLFELGCRPRLLVDPLAPLITPHDTIFNRFKASRSERQETCGMGIGTAMYRQEFSPYRIYVVDLMHPAALKHKMLQIGLWYRAKYQEFGISGPAQDKVESVWAEWRAALDRINEDGLPFEVTSWNNARESLNGEYDHMIFEGAQGVLLDRDHGAFPHVTYGHTTKRNANTLLEEISAPSTEVIYATRCYSTRHGYGPMPTALLEEGLTNTEHEINVKNTWQGEFRVRELDYNLLNYAIEVDRGYDRRYHHKHSLCVSCLDQREGFAMEYDLLPRFGRIIESRSPVTVAID